MNSRIFMSDVVRATTISRYSSLASTQKTSDYCLQLVRKHDHESFLCTLLLPPETRSAAFAIRAFNTELAMIKDLVSNPTLGSMRLQFWRDALENIYKDRPPHQPVALELSKVIQKQKLSKAWINNLINSREESLVDSPFKSVKNMEDYAEKSISSVYYLLLQASGTNDVKCDHAASHLGKAQGMTNFLRGLPFNALRGRVYVPTELLLKHNISQEDIIRRKNSKQLHGITFDIASVAHQHVDLVKSMKKDLPKSVRSVFLPIVPTSNYLDKLQKADFDVFHPKLQQTNHLLPLQLWLKNVRKTF